MASVMRHLEKSWSRVGGAQNQYFMSLLEQDSTRSWAIPSETERDFKEAICFAFLGLRRLRGEVNIWGSVTGASLDGCDGTILVETPLNPQAREAISPYIYDIHAKIFLMYNPYDRRLCSGLCGYRLRT